jgi:hypothetical protein
VVELGHNPSGKDVVAEVEVMVVVEAVTEILTHVCECRTVRKFVGTVSLSFFISDIRATAGDDATPGLVKEENRREEKIKEYNRKYLGM